MATKRSISRQQAQAFKTGWQLVNEAEKQELRRTSYEEKLQQLATLIDSVKVLGWGDKLSHEEVKVRERWNRLRKIIGARGKGSHTISGRS